MTDQPRGRRPSSGRPLRARGSQTAGTLRLADDNEPSLGDVSFDDWFETPVFESDPDERLEELATARRGPMRLAASTFLRINARASQVRRRAGQPAVQGRPEVQGQPESGSRGVPAEAEAEAEAERAPRGPAGFRQRVNDALDRWAEREAETQTRLERAILPKRWQA